MEKKIVTKAIKLVRQNSPKRNFKQSFDLIINLKNINVKKAEQQLEFFVPLHYSKGKKTRLCALVGPELESEAKSVCDTVILQEQFPKYAKDKKVIKKLAKTHTFFIAQANIMPQVATTFGRVLGPRGKMPNPKAGCVVPPKTNLKPLYDRLQKTVKISVKTEPIIQCAVGNEEMTDEEIVDNVASVYDQVIHHLPQEKNNIKSVFLKLTMGKGVRVDKTAETSKQKEQPKEKKTGEQKQEENKEEKEEAKNPEKEQEVKENA